MYPATIDAFKHVWLCDTEYGAADGGQPHIRCLVARDLLTGGTMRLWADDLKAMAQPPFATGEDSLFVAFYASAELLCFLTLGWDLPVNILDLYVEARNLRNGEVSTLPYSLLGTLAYFGLPAMESVEKESMRDLALRGGEYSDGERCQLLDYCESDVQALGPLLSALLPRLDLPRALLRGRYMAAIARMEYSGVPIDMPSLERLRHYWPRIQDELIRRVDEEFQVYDGRSFRADRFAEYLNRNGIAWPLLPTGALDLTDEAFRDMAKAYPALSTLRELRHALGQMRLSDLAVGPDGRNRCLLTPFQSRTGRNQPSNKRFIYGPAVWLRGLIQPAPGRAVAYLDYSQQEFGIAAALSGDTKMLEAYRSGDPYLSFAIQAGAVPPTATKESHAAVREQFKACVLAVQYGMGAESLSHRIGQLVARARQLLALHRQTYPEFWRWSDAMVDRAVLTGQMATVFGWRLKVEERPSKHGISGVNDRSLRNFPMQANGAEILRIACILATEAGINVCAPVHDALLIEAPESEIEAAVALTQQLMGDASEVVLDGFRLGTDAKIVRHPDRYMDKRGREMWSKVWEVIAELESRDNAEVSDAG